MRKKILEKLILVIIFALLACGILSTNVNAVSASINASSTSVKVGTKVTITIKWNAAAWNLTVSGNGISSKTYADVTDDAENASFSETISFTPSSAGTYTIKLTGSITDENSKDSTPVSDSISIKVTEKSSSSGGVGSSGGNTSGGDSDDGGDKEETPSMSFSSVNETVYATDDGINVRNSPIDGSVIGSLDKGDSVTRTGIGDGWSRIKYGGQTAYVSSSYLTTTKPATAAEEDKKNEDEDKKNEEEDKDKSNVKNLKSLTVEQYKLEPDFSPDITEYSLTIGRDVENLVIEAEAEDENATVEITGNNGLLLGTNTVNVKVTAEDGTVRTYKINVTKIEEVGLKLSELTVGGFVLSPEFSSDVYEYTLNIGDTSITSLDIVANAEDENVNVEIVGNNNLKPGENIITILVSSDDEDITTVYQIVVNIDEAFKAIAAENSDNDMYMYIGIGAAILILLIIIIVVVRKRRKAAEEEFAPLNTYNFDFSSKEEKNDLLTNDSNEEKNEEDEPKKEKKSRKREKLDDSDYSLTSTDTEETPRRGRGKHF